ncbi:TPA: hypothetical protein ACPVW6_000954 [Vibrio parahaemolyticus]|uniref:hypothetical protein n=1 Tax=Vibrio TaxID=662 RepID=UPI000403F8D5|nr:MULTISPECIES: hypothetical protein [Vibrio]EKC5521600.1 hypothetical protein [Vibrio parahaemolyticus]MBO0178099.1 hypothetical protein [Vibrio parahaemolyticus]MCF7477004.1 hypothetical protein [Vibrio sp. J2-4]MCR9470853.1 hypothetical protein [Vibrio diabolicus]HCM0805879.1 hypothetical protein [Vibrio parahaemolyticus]
MTDKFAKFGFKPMVYENHLSHPVTAGSVQYRISVLRSVFEQVEGSRKQHRDLMIELDTVQQQLTKHDETDENYDYSFSDQLIDLEFNFYRVNRISSILSMYAYLENTLNRICYQKQREFNLLISVSDFSGNGIFRARNYLEKFKLVDFSDSVCNGAWSNLINLNKLRNSLIHAEGDIEQTKKITSKTIQGIKGLSLFGSTIMISHDYVVEALSEIEKFLVYLCQN